MSAAMLEFRRCLIQVIGERTQEAFAAEIGVDQSTLSRWMNGVAPPSRRMAARIVRFYPTLREPVMHMLLAVPDAEADAVAAS